MPDLAAYLDRIRAAHGDVPGFDPAGPGIAARLLILLETPGPRIGLTGVVSLANPAGTARNLRRFLAETGIDGREVLLWNAVPWVIQPGGPIRPPRPAEVRAGIALLPPLLRLLPRLRVALLAGRAAVAAAPILAAERPGLPAFAMPHPSPTYVCTSPDVSRRITAAMRGAAAALAAHPEAREDASRSPPPP